jgi:hypothetical protein
MACERLFCYHCCLAFYLGMWGVHLVASDYQEEGRVHTRRAILLDECSFAHSVQCLCPDEPTAWWHARRR